MTSLLINGLSDQHKDFLYAYAQKELGSKSRTKAILHLIDEKIKNGENISKIDKYFNEFYDKQEYFLDYLSDKYLIFIDENSKIQQRKENIILKLCIRIMHIHIMLNNWI